MNRKAYIELLANSPLPKSAIDKTTQEPERPEFVSNYEQAVLNGFKWSESYFEKKYKIHDKLYSEVWNITKAIESLKLEQNTTTASVFWEVKQDIDNIQNTLSEITEDIDKEKELVNKRINDTNDKIEKKSKQVESKIIDLYPKINNLQSNIKEIESNISDHKIDINRIDTKNKELWEEIKTNNKQLEKEIAKNKKELDKQLESKADFDEVKTALDWFYTKEETYSKREIDRKLEDLPTKRSTTIFTWGRWWWESGPTYTPFITLTNAERLALTPSIWRTVYCTDEVEWVYIYTSDWRQRRQMIIIS